MLEERVRTCRARGLMWPCRLKGAVTGPDLVRIRLMTCRMCLLRQFELSEATAHQTAGRFLRHRLILPEHRK